ncbi:hypothetical protein WOSG25_400010, partial [Weissella oryzae SG25]
MGNFWPHDAIGWIGIIGPSLGVLAWILKTYVKDPMDRLSGKFEQLEHTTDERLDNHEKRIYALEFK